MAADPAPAPVRFPEGHPAYEILVQAMERLAAEGRWDPDTEEGVLPPRDPQTDAATGDQPVAAGSC